MRYKVWGRKMNATEELRWGLETAYIDGTVASNMAFKPQFVSQNYKEGKKVLSSIDEDSWQGRLRNLTKRYSQTPYLWVW